MKKLFVVMMFAVFSGQAFAVTNLPINAYYVGSCADSKYSNWCTYPSCGSGSPDVAPKEYPAYYCCGVYSISGSLDKRILCFTSCPLCSEFLACSSSDYNKGNGTLVLSSTTVGVISISSRSCCNCAEQYEDIDATNYQRMDRYSCNTAGKCTPTMPAYRCKVGYYSLYGESGNIRDPNCAPCATETGISIATSDVGARYITDCFVPPNTGYSDNVGDYEYNARCYWSN